ncbi:MAG: outer membrane beta-barrel protein [Dyadobacter sp.]|uniref:outer membrane beta-barrel protein n=1 Tax=Dyadobacter sp. TaxID=1914288 RepID=UPI001B1D965E|nr:outer membrane beta-barrel protein [Dyadobacter sp.]MBO9617351.1 outer membrane beta-barrel protein [Dyadobacter sp.]
MKNFLFTFLLWLIGTMAAHAQDLIVTTSGDSIRCKITREQNDFVYYTYKKFGVPAKTLIAVGNIADKRTGFYNEPVEGISMPKFRRWQYRFQGGYSRRVARISDQVPPGTMSYLKKMKSGYTLGGDIHYFISEPFGLGAKYSYSHYQHKAINFRDRILLNYFAVSGLNRLTLRSGSEVYIGANMGYQSYKDQMISNGVLVGITGGTVGVGLEAGYGMRMSDASKLYLNFSVMSGTVTKVNVNTGGRKETVQLGKGEYESLARLELTLGLAFGH